MLDIYSNYCSGDSAVAVFLTVYIEEAHSTDEWYFPHAEGAQLGGYAHIRQHTCIEERIQAARAFASSLSFQGPVMCDSMKNEVSDRFDSFPERLYIIQDGFIVYQVN